MVSYVLIVFLQVLEVKLYVVFVLLFSFEYFEIVLRNINSIPFQVTKKQTPILPAGISFALLVPSPFGPLSFTEYVPTSSSKVVLMIKRLVPLVVFVT